MNERQRRLMGKPSIESVLCPFCGRVATNRHHIVPRSAGGAKGPTVNVDGMGNASGCHKLLHDHVLHIDYDDDADCWVYLRTDEPMKDEKADMLGGWRPVGSWDDAFSV